MRIVNFFDGVPARGMRIAQETEPPSGDVDYTCDCQECGDIIERAEGETAEEQRLWFIDDSELKLCDSCA